METDDAEESPEKHKLFVGPSNAPSWKLIIAQGVLHLFRFSILSRYLQMIPLSSWLTVWAVDVVLDRDFERYGCAEEEESDMPDSEAKTKPASENQ